MVMEFETTVWMTHRRLAVGFLLVCVPVCALGMLRFRSNMEDVLQWLPNSSPEREVYNEFVAQFGADDFVVVSWPNCDLNDRRADQFSAALRAGNGLGLIRDARSGRELIVQLHEDARLPARTVIARFRGFYFGQDGHQTCVVVSLSQQGMAHRRAAMSHILSVAQSVLGEATERLVIGGYPQVGAYGDQVIRESIFQLVGPSCLVSTVLAWFCLRSLRVTLAILIVAGLAAALSIAMVTLSGALWGGLSSANPTLIYILTVSGAVHLVNYARGVTGPDLSRQILQIGWKPCVYSSVTTAAGMLSLCRSDFPAVREFVRYCAAGILVALACQLILVPVALEWLHRDLRRSPSRLWRWADLFVGQVGGLPKRLMRALCRSDLGAYGRPPTCSTSKSTTRSSVRWPDRLLNWVLRNDALVVACFLAAGIAVRAGLLSLDANLDVERNFHASTPVMRQISWLERTLGPLEQTECVLRFPNTSQDTFVERMQIVHDVQSALRALPSVRGVLSLVDSLPTEPTGGGVRRTMVRTLYRRSVNRSRGRPSTNSLFVGGQQGRALAD